MKATLLAPLLKVNTDVEMCQGSRAGGRVRRSGASGPTPDQGQSLLCAHRATAWGGSDASPAFLAGSLSSDITGQTVVIVVRRARSLRRGTR